MSRIAMLNPTRIAAAVAALIVAALFAALFMQNQSLQAKVSKLQASQARINHVQDQVSTVAAKADQIAGLADTQSDLSSQQAALSSALDGLTTQLSDMQDLSQPKSLAAQLHSLQNCVPQIEDQVSGLWVSSDEFGFATLEGQAPISRDCKAALGVTP